MLKNNKFIRDTNELTSFSLVPFVKNIRSVTPKTRIFPKRLKHGDTIGLVTPSGPIVKEQLDSTIEKLKKLGFDYFHTDAVLLQYGYLAGYDRKRAEDLMSMFSNKKISGILCIRGGYGSIRMLDMLDFEVIKQNPKVFIGYSDITALLSSIYENTGLITFHGPLGVSDFNEFTLKSLNNIVINPEENYKYPYKREDKTSDNQEFDIYTIRGGKAEGELIGGNLSVLDSMIGSRFEQDFENKIVYIEEIDEKTYKIDKMFVHLLQATNLCRAAGIVMGVFYECTTKDRPSLSLKETLINLLRPLNIPVSYGLSFGHIDTIITIPTGIKAEMNANKNTLKLLEIAVS